ncbi:MAG: DNA-binding protein [Candidatus Riflebacteria bacterium]|nr:DNA-binding protein [Candidatus Riflebacteria bacterium]
MPKQLLIQLSDDEADRLHQEAERLGVRDEDLARAVVTELLSDQDEEFRKAARYVLKKNAELYRRLG